MQYLMLEMCFKDGSTEAEYSISAGSKTTNDIEGGKGWDNRRV
jgi:hypothetical protein